MALKKIKFLILGVILPLENDEGENLADLMEAPQSATNLRRRKIVDRAWSETKVFYSLMVHKSSIPKGRREGYFINHWSLVLKPINPKNLTETEKYFVLMEAGPVGTSLRNAKLQQYMNIVRVKPRGTPYTTADSNNHNHIHTLLEINTIQISQRQLFDIVMANPQNGKKYVLTTRDCQTWVQQTLVMMKKVGTSITYHNK